MDLSYTRLRNRLEGLTDDEFFWEPVPGCWTIYKKPDGRWTYNYEIPDPEPAPSTTIGWQLIHLATCKVIYHEWAYGPGQLTFPDLVIPPTAAGAVAMLGDGQRLLRAQLESLAEIQLDELRRTNWGDMWPAWRVFAAMADHDAFHGGVIGYLRDLYYWSHVRLT